MTAAQIRAVRVERTASLDDTLRSMLEVLIEIAAQLADANEIEREAQGFVREGNWHRHNC